MGELLDKIRSLSEKVTQTESELSAFFHLCPALFCIGTSDGYFYRVNEAWEKLLGWSAHELYSKPYKDFIHPDDIEATTAAENKMANGEQVINLVNRYRCKDGSYKKLMWQADSYTDGSFTYASCIEVKDGRG